jgi:hypothetical protein
VVTQPLPGAIALPDGTTIRGRGLRLPMPAGPLPDFGLYLGRPPGTLLRRSRWRPDWPADRIDWPDFRTPRDGAAAAAAIVHAYTLATAGYRVEVACGGGTGRTGTVIACMSILAGCPAAEAVSWARRHYRPRAVETAGQRRWIAWFASRARDASDGRRDREGR